MADPDDAYLAREAKARKQIDQQLASTDFDVIAPSAIPHRIYQAVLGSDKEAFSTAVATSYKVDPKGATLEELAVKKGIW